MKLIEFEAQFGKVTINSDCIESILEKTFNGSEYNCDPKGGPMITLISKSLDEKNKPTWYILSESYESAMKKWREAIAKN